MVSLLRQFPRAVGGTGPRYARGAALACPRVTAPVAGVARQSGWFVTDRTPVHGVHRRSRADSVRARVCRVDGQARTTAVPGGHDVPCTAAAVDRRRASFVDGNRDSS